MKKYVDVYTILKLVFILSNIYQYCSSTIPCSSRKQNCSLCLIDGECGFCDSCGDHCHQPQTLHSLQNCTGCAQCVPGTLIGPKKGYECRHEWLVYFEFLVKTKLFGFFSTYWNFLVILPQNLISSRSRSRNFMCLRGASEDLMKNVNACHKSFYLSE